MSMHGLGETRSRRTGSHLLQTPDTFVWAPLPGMVDGTACVHAAPALGAGFVLYTARLDASGSLPGTAHSRFVFVLEGALHLRAAEQSATLGAGGFAFVPAGLSHGLQADTAGARAVVLEKPYVPLPGVPGRRCWSAAKAASPQRP